MRFIPRGSRQSTSPSESHLPVGCVRVAQAGPQKQYDFIFDVDMGDGLGHFKRKNRIRNLFGASQIQFSLPRGSTGVRRHCVLQWGAHIPF